MRTKMPHKLLQLPQKNFYHRIGERLEDPSKSPHRCAATEMEGADQIFLGRHAGAIRH